MEVYPGPARRARCRMPDAHGGVVEAVSEWFSGCAEAAWLAAELPAGRRGALPRISPDLNTPWPATRRLRQSWAALWREARAVARHRRNFHRRFARRPTPVALLRWLAA